MRLGERIDMQLYRPLNGILQSFTVIKTPVTEKMADKIEIILHTIRGKLQPVMRMQ